MIFNLRARGALKTLGGRFVKPWPMAKIASLHREPLEYDVRNFAAARKKEQRYWFSFCQSDQVNAFAIPLGPDKYFLSLTSGIVLVLYGVILRLVGKSDAFLHLSERDTHSMQRATLRIGDLQRAKYVHLLISLYTTVIKEPVPSLPQAQLAFTIAHLALEFTLAHEVGHISKGHLDYRAKKDRYSLLRGPQIEKIPADFRQHLEIAADEWAWRLTFSQLAHFASVHDYSKGPLIIGPGTTPFYSRTEVVDLWLFSVTLLFIVLGSRSDSEADYFQSTHPFPAYRLQRAYSILGEEEFGKWTQGSRFRDPYQTVEFVAKQMESVDIEMGAFLRSLDRYIREDHAKRIEDRILAGFARDDITFGQISFQETEWGESGPEVRAELTAFFENLNACLEMLRVRDFKDIEEVRKSPEFEAMKASQAFQLLMINEKLKRVMHSRNADDLLAYTDWADPRAVALASALRDAMK